jgi:pimeloyl-ACP methyl ester carboxylesterase
LDRPGYGYSNYGRSEIDLHKQAQAIRHIVANYPQKKVILIGHSYGGPIIGKYAMDDAKSLKGIVMLAPVNDPENEPMFWFAHFGRWKLTRWMIPGSLRVSADEKFSHAEELAKIADDWVRIGVPVVHIHGYKDKLAPPVNIDFSKERIAEQYLKMVEMDTNHFIPWSDYEVVKRELMALMVR